MYKYIRTGIAAVGLILIGGQILAQTEDKELPLELNGLLYEVIPNIESETQRAYLWSLELQELSRNYELVESSSQRKRASILFYNETAGRDWRKFWGERMRLVYASSPELVNDHAEGFFGITGSFPNLFNAGDRFSLESLPDGSTQASLNGQIIATAHKPEHFEFWLRAWYTGVEMPEIFRGNLLAGGLIPDDLVEAHVNSELPKPVRSETDEQSGTSEQNTAGQSNLTDSAAAVENVAWKGVVPVILENRQSVRDL